MINLKLYSGNAFEFHKNAIARKNTTQTDVNYKTRVSALNSDVEAQFTLYDNHYAANTLQILNSLGYSGQNKNDLLSLYSYKSKVIQQLKLQVTTTDTNRIINSCQNCTINEINSCDHILPKEEYAEYVVNPKNLFPSCTMCNGFKATAWRDNGRRVFLNLYLDLLPKEQYLFVDINVFGEDVKTTFKVINPNNIDHDLFELIQSHYSKLHLCKRFSDNNDTVITPLKNDISASKGKLSVAEIREIVVNRCHKNMESFGYNYWKSILEITLVNDDDFMQSIIEVK